jgi:hypothetical protein
MNRKSDEEHICLLLVAVSERNVNASDLCNYTQNNVMSIEKQMLRLSKIVNLQEGHHRDVILIIF